MLYFLAIQYISLGQGFCADDFGNSLAYVYVFTVNDVCQMECDSTNACLAYSLSQAGCLLYGDTSTLISNKVCDTFSCLTMDGSNELPADTSPTNSIVECFAKQGI